MEFIDKIRQKCGVYFFKKSLSKLQRTKRIVNFSEAITIGLIYDASDEAVYNKVSNFICFLQDEKKTVKALGFVNYKNLPHYCFQKLSYDYFTLRDINWYFKPIHPRVKDFINEDFDILINVCLHECFVLSYITGLSEAKLKVGRYGEKYSGIYDFMLNVDNNISLDDYFKQIIYYLTIINRKNDKK